LLGGVEPHVSGFSRFRRCTCSRRKTSRSGTLKPQIVPSTSAARVLPCALAVNSGAQTQPPTSLRRSPMSRRLHAMPGLRGQLGEASGFLCFGEHEIIPIRHRNDAQSQIIQTRPAQRPAGIPAVFVRSDLASFVARRRSRRTIVWALSRNDPRDSRVCRSSFRSRARAFSHKRFCSTGRGFSHRTERTCDRGDRITAGDE